MANQSGTVYGLTILAPIIDDPKASPSHDLQIRVHLAHMLRGAASPFAAVSSTHLARLVVMDDVVYVGMPSCEEHLQSKYLIFEANFDGSLDSYLAQLAIKAAADVDAIFSHCVGYPGVSNVAAFTAYMKACQIETTFYFAAVNDKSVQQTLRALETQRAVSAFIQENQSKPAAELQRAFLAFVSSQQNLPAPVPGLAVGETPPGTEGLKQTQGAPHE